mgnify:CR=1 FL=1
MSITQTVRCDDCNRLLLEGANRMPVIITMTVDVQAGPDKPPRIHHLHFCKDACIGSFLTKQAAAKLDAAVNYLSGGPASGLVSGDSHRATPSSALFRLAARPALLRVRSAAGARG